MNSAKRAEESKKASEGAGLSAESLYAKISLLRFLSIYTTIARWGAGMAIR